MISEYAREMKKQFELQLSEARYNQLLKDNGINKKRVRVSFKIVNDSLKNRRKKKTPNFVLLDSENYQTDERNNLFFLTNRGSIRN